MVLGKNHKWFSQDVIVVTQTSAWPDGVLFFTILLWHTLKRTIALRKSSSNSRVSYGPKYREIYHIWVMRTLLFESNPSQLTSTLNVLSSKLVRNKCKGGNALPNKVVSMDRWCCREWGTPKSSLGITAPLAPDRRMSKNSAPSLKSTSNSPVFYGLSRGAI